MAEPSKQSQRVVESVTVRRVPRFNQAGGKKQFNYTISLVTVLGNSGTFEIPAEVYEDDEQYTDWLQLAVFQLDKSYHMTH